MTDPPASDEPLEIDAIPDAGIPPARAADDLTRGELKKRERQAKAPSAVQRHIDEVEGHKSDLRTDRDRLRSKNQRLQDDLDRLRPRHAALQEAYNASLASNVLSTITWSVSEAP